MKVHGKISTGCKSFTIPADEFVSKVTIVYDDKGIRGISIISGTKPDGTSTQTEPFIVGELDSLNSNGY